MGIQVFVPIPGPTGHILSRINFCTFSLPQVQRYRFGIHLFSLRCFSLKDGRVLGAPNALREERLKTEIRAKIYAQQYRSLTSVPSARPKGPSAGHPGAWVPGSKHENVVRSLPLYILFLVGFLSQLCWAEKTSLLLSPAPDAEIQSRDLVVSVTVSGPLSESLNLGTAKLFVGDRNVTGLCLRNDTYMSFRPLNPMPTGPVEARLEFSNGLVKKWNFEVVPTEFIKSVTHNGREALGEYQDLKVRMEAEPGIKATFTIDTKRKEHPMTEVSRGVYEGTYTVKPGDYFLGVPIHGHLHFGSRKESRKSEEPAKLFGHLFRVHIIEPVAGKAPSKNFTIKGRTRPGSKVSIVPRLSLNSNTPAPSSRWGRGGGGNIEAQANDEGFFEIDYGVPITLPNLSVVLNVYAVSPSGERSVPITLRYDF